MKTVDKTNWRRTILNKDATIAMAIESLNNSMMQIVLVLDEYDVLCGTITDGDIRRALLKGRALNDNAFTIMNPEPFVVSEGISSNIALELMNLNSLNQLPIVNLQNKVIGLHLKDSLLGEKVKSNSMIIMAGGKGTRLRPQTENCPKPMIEVAGMPMLEHIILRAKSNGFTSIYISLNYLGHMIEDYFKDGSDFGVSISYIKEDIELGTAGALSLIDTKFEYPIVVTNGDVLTEVNYSEILDFHLSHKADATMAVRQYSWRNPFGVVKTQGVNIIGFEEKPELVSNINAGIYVLAPKAFSYLERNEFCDMPTLFQKMLADGCETIVYPMHEKWMDVGRPDDLKTANSILMKSTD